MDMSTQVTDLGHAWDLAHLEAASRAALHQVNTINRTLESTQSDLVRARADLDRYRAQVAAEAITAKEENGWCDSGFADAMRRLGLVEFVTRDVDIRITFTVTLTDVGPDGPDGDAVDKAAHEFITDHLSANHWREV